MNKYLKIILPFLGLILVLISGVFIKRDIYKSNLTLGLFSDGVWDIPILVRYKIYDDAITDFIQDHEGLNISYRSGTLKEDYSEWLSQKMLLGEQPDVFLLFNTDFSTFASIGALQDLDSFIEKDSDFDIDKFYKNAAQLGIYEDNYYALPMELNPMVMGVNMDLLEKEGIDLPDHDLTWDDFYDICNQVTKDINEDGVMDQFGCVGFDWQQAMNTNSVNLFDTKNGRGLFNSPQSQYAVDFVQKLDSLNGTYKVTVDDFEKGKVAFIVFPFSEYLSYSKYPYKIIRNINFNWKCMKLPIGPNGNSAGTFQSLLVAINPKSKNKELAWEFMKHLVYSENVQSKIYNSSFGVPVIKDIAESDEVNKEFEKDIPDTNFLLDPTILSDIIETSYLPTRFSNYERAMDLADKELYSVIDNGHDITSSLQILNKKINELLQLK